MPIPSAFLETVPTQKRARGRSWVGLRLDHFGSSRSGGLCFAHMLRRAHVSAERRIEKLPLNFSTKPMELTVADFAVTVELADQQLDEDHALIGQERTAELHDASDLLVG